MRSTIISGRCRCSSSVRTIAARASLTPSQEKRQLGIHQLLAKRLRRQWNHYLYVTAGLRLIDGYSDSFQVKPNIGPLLAGQDYDGNFPVAKVLLIANVLVSAQKEIVAGLFSAFDQDPRFPTRANQVALLASPYAQRGSAQWIAVYRDRTKSSR